MTVLLRSFIVWLMLLALPYQGYASAAMMLCAPTNASTSTSTLAGAHDHAAMMTAMQDGAYDGLHDTSQHSAQHHAGSGTDIDHSEHAHGGVKCGGAACCVAGAPMMTLAIAVPALPAVSSPVPFYSEVLHAVDLAHPERPPQGNFV